MKIIDKEIHINRGDRLLIDFSIENGENKYIFKDGDKIKFSIYEKKGMDKPPVLQKEFTPAVGSTSVDIDITSWQDKENFTIYIIPHDDYANSYYYMADPITTEKIKYGKPKLTVKLSQSHSENGDIKIKYEHEDLVKNADGSYTSKDQHRDPANGDFDGLVSIYCFIRSVI